MLRLWLRRRWGRLEGERFESCAGYLGQKALEGHLVIAGLGILVVVPGCFSEGCLISVDNYQVFLTYSSACTFSLQDCV